MWSASANRIAVPAHKKSAVSLTFLMNANQLEILDNIGRAQYETTEEEAIAIDWFAVALTCWTRHGCCASSSPTSTLVCGNTKSDTRSVELSFWDEREKHAERGRVRERERERERVAFIFIMADVTRCRRSLNGTGIFRRFRTIGFSAVADLYLLLILQRDLLPMNGPRVSRQFHAIWSNSAVDYLTLPQSELFAAFTETGSRWCRADADCTNVFLLTRWSNVGFGVIRNRAEASMRWARSTLDARPAPSRR